MSLQPVIEYSVPDDTARVAHAIFPKVNIYIVLASELKTFLVDEDFADLFPRKGQPAESPLRLALATVLQYIEGLTDRQTANAVRTRIDWKYLLCLELTDSGFHHTVLSEFRTRLIAGGAEALILEKLLQLCQEKGWLKSRMRQRTDSTHVLSAIRAVTRLECVGETLRTQLNYQALQAARQRETTTEFKKEYARRAGIEGTMSEAIRVHHLRRTRYVGLEKTHLQHLMTAVAINFKRLFNWLTNVPLATTRISPYSQLMTNSVAN